MRSIVLQQLIDTAVTMGPIVLMRGMQLRRPTDVVEASSLSIEDKRTILAAWASDLYAIDSTGASALARNARAGLNR